MNPSARSSSQPSPFPSHHPKFVTGPVFTFIHLHRLALILLCLSTIATGIMSASATDIPFVFDQESLQSLDAPLDLKTSDPSLEGVPAIESIPETEVMEFTETGGPGGQAGGKNKMTVADLKEIYNSRVEAEDSQVRGQAAELASDYPGELNLDQICAIFDFLKNGDDTMNGWKYVEDPRGKDYYAYSNETLKLGAKKSSSGIGDCDDFAILMAAMVEAIGGTTRIILAYNQTVGHAYTEVYLGCFDTDPTTVKTVVAALKERYGIDEVFTHIDDQTGDVWLNLDWGQDKTGVSHPGGPFFQGDQHVPLRIRDMFGMTPVRPPASFRMDEASGAISVLGVFLNPNSSPVRIVTWRPDGMTIASGNYDNMVNLWDLKSGRLIRTLDGHTGPVRIVSWSPDGMTLASGSGDDTVNLWYPDSGRLLRTLKGHSGWVKSVTWSPDGMILALGCGTGTVNLLESDSGRLLHTLYGHSDSVLSIAWSPNGMILASGSFDGAVKFWNPDSGHLIRTLDGHTSIVWSMCWSHDSTTLASCSDDRTIKLWDVGSGRLIQTMYGNSSNILSVAWNPNGRTLASGSSDGTVKLWDPASGRLLRILDGHTDIVWSVAWSPDGMTLASGSSDGTIRLWRVV